METTKVALAGSELRPVGKRVGDQPNDETIEVSVILKPKTRAAAPHEGGAIVSREEFAAKHGADSATIEKVKEFAKENNLTVSEVSPERRTVKLEGTAADMTRAFEVSWIGTNMRVTNIAHGRAAIKLPPDLAPSVEAVLGLDDRPQAKAALSDSRSADRQPRQQLFPTRRARLRSFISFRSTWMEPGRPSAFWNWAADIHPADLKNYFSSLGIKEPTVISVSVDKGKNKPTNREQRRWRSAAGYRSGGIGGARGEDRSLFRAQYVAGISGCADHGDS